MTRSPFAWPGGKRALTPVLLALTPKHRVYVEVFAGSAKLLFSKPESDFEVLNDINGDVTNFFRICKHRTAELTELLELECIHAGRFRELQAQQPQDELERALQFAYLTWYSFGGKGAHFAQACAGQGAVRKPLTRVRELLAGVAKRLASVQIETQDWSTILRRYDSPETFFYLDPPYVEYQENSRYAPMDAERRAAMFAALAQLQGRFLLSFDDHAEIRAAAELHGFALREETVTYTLAGGSNNRKKAPELLVSNFEIASA
jgi:DNA adenine methylase